VGEHVIVTQTAGWAGKAVIMDAVTLVPLRNLIYS